MCDTAQTITALNGYADTIDLVQQDVRLLQVESPQQTTGPTMPKTADVLVCEVRKSILIEYPLPNRSSETETDFSRVVVHFTPRPMNLDRQIRS